MFEVRTLWQKALFVLAFVCIGIYVFFPTYWMVNTALKPAQEVFNPIPTFWPTVISLAGFKEVFRDQRIWVYLKNSLTVSLISSGLATVIAAYAGYSFSKFRYRGRKAFMYLILTAQMFPFVVLLL